MHGPPLKITTAAVFSRESQISSASPCPEEIGARVRQFARVLSYARAIALNCLELHVRSMVYVSKIRISCY